MARIALTKTTDGAKTIFTPDEGVVTRIVYDPDADPSKRIVIELSAVDGGSSLDDLQERLGVI